MSNSNHVYRTLAGMILMVVIGISVPCSAKTKCGPTCDARAQLTMQELYNEFGYRDSALDVWVNGDYGPSGKLRLEKRENRLEKMAIWAATLSSPDKKAYLSSIEYYEDGAKEAYSEWHTHKLQHTQAAYEKHLRECIEAARKSSHEKALPKFPKESAR